MSKKPIYHLCFVHKEVLLCTARLSFSVGSDVSWSISFIDENLNVPTVASSGKSNKSEKVSMALDLSGYVSRAITFPLYAKMTGMVLVFVCYEYGSTIP